MKPATRRADEPTSDRIVTAATELFYRQGYPKTSVREITAALGLTPGALYRHYRSKDELLHAICVRTHELNDKLITEALARGGEDPAMQLRELARATTLFGTTSRLEAIVSRNEAHHLPPAQAQEMLTGERRVRRVFERTLERGVEAGVFQIKLGDGGPADLAVVAKAVLDMCVGVGIWYRPDGAHSAKDLAEHYASLALSLVGVAPTSVPQPPGAVAPR